ncbi:hypothetical protein NSZ01_04960 [Nocardioides szechwanensis]|nr:hypothetical protein NSZ01_04960 [Nocardioides szechwanensis]
MDWLFEGLGTLIVGLLIGGAGGAYGGYRIGMRSVRQTQTAHDHATQTQVGGNDRSKRRRG